MSIGIDTDSSGKIACLLDKETLIFDIPIVTVKMKRGTRSINSKRIDCVNLYKILKKIYKTKCNNCTLYYEDQKAAAFAGAGAAFTFASNFGNMKSAIEIVCSIKAVNAVPVSAMKWKKEFKIIGKPKTASKEVVQKLLDSGDLPELNKRLTIPVADAILIALYGKKHEEFPDKIQGKTTIKR